MIKKITVLLAEDELSLGKIISESLENKGFEVIYCIDGEVALKQYKIKSPDILVLDVMMPKKDGFTLAKEIRRNNQQIPILFLTAKSQTIDVVEGFHSGGNDYLKKPFSMEELIVRIEHLVMRSNTSFTHSDKVDIGLYQFHYKKQKLQINDTILKLTSRETDLLHQLYLNKNNILDKDYILNKLWGNNDFFKARSMDVFITKLRKKLNQDQNVQIINVRGYGYKLIC